MVFCGLVDGGPLEPKHGFLGMTWPVPTVTVCVGKTVEPRVLMGRQHGRPGEVATEYGWTWGVWLCGEPLAAARLAYDVAG